MSEQRNETNSLSEKDFKFICQFVHDASGIVLGERKREMVYRRLTRITRERKLNSFSDYCELLRTQPEQEENYFINAITTNLTSFFRENHHFEYLQQHEIPRIIAQEKKSKGQNKRIRIWSSASSTGEEPYSIAITLLETMQDQLTEWDVKVLATDVDSNVLAHGSMGIYANNRIEDLPIAIKKKYFVKGSGSNSKNVKISGKLKDLLTFKRLNLLHDWPMKGPFDVIFCRNVIIYFDKKTQQELFSRYYELLKPGGILILGHSENLGEYQQYFYNEGRTIFRKPELEEKG
ncbi:protein-glutamate O-methyltransferase CheR [Colwellia sp. BRX8-9]|uniref:CheR family methyltransferase n=1 Tax=Colwellia sp. BRX8-9 TaxID=2759831 RepID=UPI0015F4394A|nr:protein-glutamate O-methyltransferase CheR [Colwellia sp. BRX8-9]MBA6349844.1 protein-glutamate O-methyltransferase CheR [Colwellia sp. BRX8-9]